MGWVAHKTQVTHAILQSSTQWDKKRSAAKVIELNQIWYRNLDGSSGESFDCINLGAGMYIRVRLSKEGSIGLGVLTLIHCIIGWTIVGLS